MAVTKTETRSWGERIGSSLKGIVIGLVLIGASLAGLFWNEGRAVTTARSLDEGRGVVVSIDPAAPVPANDGSLVHLAGPVSAETALSDADFGVETAGLGLFRIVEMYQWRERSRSETRTQTGGGQETVTTYSYEQEWSGRPLESARFQQPEGHENPPMTLSNAEHWAQDARLGAFALSPDILERLNDRQPLMVDSDEAVSVSPALSIDRPASIADGGLYLGENPQAPQIGDYRIRYEILPIGPVSIVGQQQGDGIAPYRTEAGDGILIVSSGEVPAEQMFEGAQANNALMTWVLRAVGLVALYLGFAMLLAPLGVLSDVLPFFERIVSAGTGLVAFGAAAVLGASTIALAWLFYRPIVAICVIAIGIVLALGGSFLMKRRKRVSEARPA